MPPFIKELLKRERENWNKTMNELRTEVEKEFASRIGHQIQRGDVGKAVSGASPLLQYGFI